MLPRSSFASRSSEDTFQVLRCVIVASNLEGSASPIIDTPEIIASGDGSRSQRHVAVIDEHTMGFPVSYLDETKNLWIALDPCWLDTNPLVELAGSLVAVLKHFGKRQDGVHKRILYDGWGLSTLSAKLFPANLLGLTLDARDWRWFQRDARLSKVYYPLPAGNTQSRMFGS